MPRFSEDDVIDFQVTEAVIARGRIQQNEEQEKAQHRSWKKQGIDEKQIGSTPLAEE